MLVVELFAEDCKYYEHLRVELGHIPGKSIRDTEALLWAWHVGGNFTFAGAMEDAGGLFIWY